MDKVRLSSTVMGAEAHLYVDTPADTVVIAETFFYGNERRDLMGAEYKNMAGRAGRLGLSERGRSVLLADNAMERERLFERYVLGEPEPIR